MQWRVISNTHKASSCQEGSKIAGVTGPSVISDPYPLVATITRIVRGLSADQPVERAATLGVNPLSREP